MKNLSRNKLAEVRSLQHRKFREKLRLSFVEGENAVGEILRSHALVKYLVYSDEKHKEMHAKFAGVIPKEIEQFVLDDAEFNTVCATVNSQGVLAVVEFPTFVRIEDIDKYKKILVFDRIQDPGNVGTLIRSASAFGVELIISISGTAELMNPKVIRASAGLLWQMKFAQNIGQAAFSEKIREKTFNVFVADMNGDDFYDCSIEKPWMLVLGNEGAGISNDFKIMDNKNWQKIKISHEKNVESLNVAVAGSIILSWLHKQEMGN